MKLRWIKTHWIVKKIFKNYVWDIPNKHKNVFLTFDDGPTPEITEWTLSQLKRYNAKATFFCIGKNIENNPEILEKIYLDGHSIGNHTCNHLSGWKTNNTIYLKNIQKCQDLILKLFTELLKKQSKIFRPPYGKITLSQSYKLRKLGYKIIMWDIISYDFDTTISKEECLKNILDNVKSGSIIVFHDSEKAFQNLEFILPKTLRFLRDSGFNFEKIDY